jgi:hypothetical protein
LLGTSQCQKSNKVPPDNPYGLPNATQEGDNIFACLVNGQTYIAYYDGVMTKASYINDTLGLTGSPKIKDYFEIIGFQFTGNPILDIHNIDGVATYGKFATDSTCSQVASLVK